MTLLFLTPGINGFLLGVVATVVGGLLIIRNNKASVTKDINTKL